MSKRKLRFNAVDAILLIVIAVVILAVLYIFVFSGNDHQTTDVNYRNIQYVVLVQNLDEHYDSIIKTGQPVTDGVEKKSIGTVTGIQSSPMLKTTFDYETGRETESEVENKIMMKITIEAQAVATDRAFTVDGCEIRVGEQYSLMLPNFYCTGYCIDINDNQQK